MVALGPVGCIREIPVSDAEGGDVCGVRGGAVAQQGGDVSVVLQAGQNNIQLHSLKEKKKKGFLHFEIF